MKEELIAPVRPALRMLFASVGFVLLIACANVTNLFLIRTAARRREIAIRGALGAGRGQLVRQVLADSVILGLAGGVAGTLLALSAVQLVRRLGAGGIPRLEEVGIDVSVLAFTLIASLLSGLIFGIAPALHVARSDHMEVIREGAAADSSGLGLFGRYRTLSFIVIAEIAIVMVLLVGGGLMIRSFMKLINVNSGFNSKDVLTFRVSVPRERYRNLAAFQLTVIERLKSLPDVQFASTVETLPVAAEAGGWFTYLRGTPVPTDGQPIRMRFVSQDYLKTMGIQVIQGRGFEDNDRAGQPAVVLISEAFARRYFAGQDPIGKAIFRYPPAVGAQGREIVGVVDDVRESGLHFEPEPQIYFDIRQFSNPATNRVSFAVRTASEPATITRDVRSLIRQMDPGLMLEHIASMDDIVYRSVARPRFYAVLFGVFGGVALVLAAIGIYGVISYSVTQRTQEIGIRMALGAQTREVLALVLKQGTAVTIAGLMLGLAGAMAATRHLETLLFGMTPFDTFTFAAVSAVFVFTAILACYLPARRATRIDPLVALRHE
jgi:putative ABC transport system permease protein